MSIAREIKKYKVFSFYLDNTWAADLEDMKLISKYNKGVRFLLCVIDIYSKYAWVVTLKNKKGISVTDAFQKILDKTGGSKPSKTWIDQGSELHNPSMKSWFRSNGNKLVQHTKKENLSLQDLLEP